MMKSFIKQKLRESIRAEEAYTDANAISTVIRGKRSLGFITLKGATISEDYFWYLMDKYRLKTLEIPKNPNKTYVYYKPKAEMKAHELKKIADKYDGYLAWNATEEDSIRIGELLEYNPMDIKDYIERNRKLSEGLPNVEVNENVNDVYSNK